MSKRLDLLRPEPEETIAAFIQRLIGGTGLNQTQFAEHVGLTRQTINSTVNGLSQISPATARKLQAALQCDGRHLVVQQAIALFDAVEADEYRGVKRLKVVNASAEADTPFTPDLLRRAKRYIRDSKAAKTASKIKRRRRGKV